MWWLVPVCLSIITLIRIILFVRVVPGSGENDEDGPQVDGWVLDLFINLGLIVLTVLVCVSYFVACVIGKGWL
jgi:hypothetical protein